MRSKAHKSRRRRSRRPKFLSLRHQITAESQRPPAAEEEEKIEQECEVAGFFAAAEESAATLDGILTPEKEDTAAATPSTAFEEEEGDDDAGTSLERAALRSCREREEGAVRWVRMSEVVKEEEVSSCRGRTDVGGASGGLALKLDYEEVVEAWCGGRPFFMGDQSEGPQTVPDLQLHNDFFFCPPDLNAGNGVLWGVPDRKSCVRNGKDENGDETVEGWRLGQREASVLRYKEKRMNRLFSKRIRYQVRKLNAEKRPRVKGRFVKRS